jgi:hypothetical protein
MKSIKTLIAASLLICSFMVNAQAKFKLGVGGGVNFANFSGSNVSGTKGFTGFNGGLITEIKLPIKVGVEADVLFSTKGAKHIVFPSDLPEGSIGTFDYKLSYIDIPIVLKIYMLKVINLQLGAQYSILMNAESVGSSIKDLFNSSDFSAVIGFGIDVKRFHFSTRYIYGLTGISEGSDTKNKMLTLTVGFWLKK